MNFEIKEIKNGNVWDDFFLDIDEKTFLNSWSWTLFREDMGDKILRKGIWLNNNLLAVFFISKIKSKKGNFLLLSHSPSIKKNHDGLIEKIINEVKEIAKNENVSFIRMAPIWKENSDNDKIIKKEGFIESSCFIFPEKSWELDLNQDSDEILSKMRKGTRYMIKKGIKENKLKLSISKQESDVETFYKIYKETSFRHNFIPFSLDYIKKEFNYFSKNEEAVLILANNGDKCVAGAFIVFWQKNAFYHHGASLVNKENDSASYLVQWEAIKEARKRECEKYNFWVISSSNSPKHRWAGLTFFKKGFGGYETNYAKTKDFPLSKKYWLTYFFEKIKR